VIIDVLIVLIVVGTAWVGFQRGMIQPLLAELFVLVTVLLMLHNRDGFAALVQAFFHANGALAVVIGVVVAGLMGYLGLRLGGAIHKMPVVQGVDGFVGVWMQALFGIGLCYVLISGIIVMDRALIPLTATNVNVTQLRVIEQDLASNAFTSGAVDGSALRTFETRAARPGGVPVADLPGVATLQGLARDFLVPQLSGSHLAPVVMNVGRHIPGMGPYGSRDLPKRT